MSFKTVTVRLYRDGAMCFIPVPFDPKVVFGKVRVPVNVTVNSYTYRSTISRMGGVTCIPLRKSNREAANLNGDETVSVTIALDTEAREVALPDDLKRALRADDVAWRRWHSLSYTQKREHAEAIATAKRADTRAKRLTTIVRSLQE